MQWNDNMDEAPRDVWILVCQSANVIIKTARGVDEYGDWITGPGHLDFIAEVTHWMPLPEPPR